MDKKTVVIIALVIVLIYLYFHTKPQTISQETQTDEQELDSKPEGLGGICQATGTQEKDFSRIPPSYQDFFPNLPPETRIKKLEEEKKGLEKSISIKESELGGID